jgi:tRNA1Val (adenine37-N6)-methyltransferase
MSQKSFEIEGMPAGQGPAAGELTRDSLWGGDLVFWQPARGRGYRFNLDPVLLSAFASPARHVLDLGSGVGVLGILLLATGKAERVTAVEVQPALAELTRRNARENGLADRLHVITGDCREQPLPAVDAVVFNPPYFRPSEGQPAPDRCRDVARHERHGTLADFVARAAAVIGTSGHVAVIIPARRGPELEALLRQAGAFALRRRLVLPRDGEAAGHWMLEGRFGPGAAIEALRHEPPLLVHGAAGRDFTPEVRGILHET